MKSSGQFCSRAAALMGAATLVSGGAVVFGPLVAVTQAQVPQAGADAIEVQFRDDDRMPVGEPVKFKPLTSCKAIPAPSSAKYVEITSTGDDDNARYSVTIYPKSRNCTGDHDESKSNGTLRYQNEISAGGISLKYHPPQ
ncbi:hypothetical protein [Nocardia sp. NPDC057030]|uniref:hypothetical protein n=1 Tax=unclassified Nocardia TaxID=2637762 RepID=UPI00363A3EC5